MAKKAKRNAPGPVRPVASQPTPSQPVPANKVPAPASSPVLDKPRPTAPPDGLIWFDRRTRLTLGIMTALLFLMVLGKLHYVSLPIWNQLLPDGGSEKRGLLAGTPKQIRMDDYAVGAPWTLSNINHGFPDENEALGGLKAPLLIAPVKHSVNLFKPHFWGFMLLDAERGYAWMYDTSPYILLVGSFLFFLLVSGNQFWLALTGSLTLLFSSGTAWWSFIPTSMIGYCCLAFVVTVYLLHERRPVWAAGYAVLLVWLMICYVLILYPPYQIPLAYLFILILIGYVINKRAQIFPLPAVAVKLLALVGAALVFGWVLSFFYADAKETLEATSNTVYPGKRSETGGTGFIANWYSEYYSWFFSDQLFPKSWLNICEMSHYLNFSPVVIPLSILIFIRKRQIDWVLAGAIFFVIALWIWVEIGYPEALAKATLLSVTPTRRAQIPLGVGGIVLLFLYLGKLRDVELKLPVWANGVAIVAIVGFMVYTAYVNVNDSDGMIKPYQTFLPVLYFSLLNGLLLFSLPIRYRTALFCVGILAYLSPNLKANPLAKGLTPLTENAFYVAVQQLYKQNPEARWIVNGNQFLTYMVTATGAKQITGVKYIPDRKHIFKVLDPTAKRDSAYNRYAHVTFGSYINGTDSVILANQYEDGYVIAMDPCSPRMKALNVGYMVYDREPQAVEVRCMTLVQQLGTIRIYKVNL